MTEPHWDLTGDTVQRLRDELATLDESTRTDFGDFAEFIAEQLAEYRIDLTSDQMATYHGLAFMSLLVDLVRNNFDNGAIDHQTAAAVTAMVRSVATVLAQHAPD